MHTDQPLLPYQPIFRQLLMSLSSTINNWVINWLNNDLNVQTTNPEGRFQLEVDPIKIQMTKLD